MILKSKIFVLVVHAVVLLHTHVHCDEYNETEIAAYLDSLSQSYSYECNLEMTARWGYITDIDDPTAEAVANDAAVRFLTFQGEAAANVSQFDYENFTDVDLYRQARFQSSQGAGGLSQSDLVQYKALQSEMETTYSTATICAYGQQGQPDCTKLALEPDIEAIMANSTDWDELTYVWEEWREVSGKLMRDNFTEFVALSNEAAVLDGFDDTGDYWINGYTVTAKEVAGYELHGLDEITGDGFQQMVETVWNGVSTSLYKKLHAYVRMKMKDLYPEHIDATGPIPAQILGNMWAQDWTNIATYVMPFPDQPTYDVTESMQQNGWDIDQMFLAAEDFFKSIGLYEMTDDFWSKSVINQTAWGKNIVCHASAEDFCLGPENTDFRIKMCTEVNMNDLVTVHHEMGHIEYFMAYTNLSYVYRTSANPGFHEAIGDTIALSVSTPTHMENILNLTASAPQRRSPRYTVDEERDLNFLMRMALEKIAFLPFGYLIDKYRWGVYDGSISNEELNAGWWNLRESLQGVTPPNGARGEEFFDPGAKYHVPANVPYIRYFVSFIVQFQFHKRLCEVAGYQGPLHKCDIYSNTDAGDLLRNSLAQGFSKPWPIILNMLGNSMVMDSGPITEYFQPLLDYLDTVLVNECIGWDSDCAKSDQTLEEQLETLEEQLDLMDETLTPIAVTSIEASWNYNTDSNAANAAIMEEASGNFSSAYREWWEMVIKDADLTGYPDGSSVSRQVELQQSIGTAILNATEYDELNRHVTAMTDAFNNKVCAFDDLKCDPETEGLTIDEMEIKMADNSLEYAELLHYWTSWRDVSGKEVLPDYIPYIDLENQAAVLNDFPDAGVMWLNPYVSGDYTTDDFKMEIEEILNKIMEELYQNLHAYVSYKLKSNSKFEDHFDDDNLIPAHILGNMWAQSWENIYDYVVPFPNVPLIDLTPELEQNIKNSSGMFKYAEDFFTSLNMSAMTDDFWANSMYDQPEGKVVVCHASAWDFMSTYNTDQIHPRTDGRYRIKMCTDKNQEDFIVIHHEMGHTQYQMAYSETPQGEKTPLIFRDGANPGFHEAIGDTIALSVSTPTHLQMISDSLTNSSKGRSDLTSEEQYQQDINFLMKQALAKVAFLPFSYILDEWRWEAFASNVSQSVFNKRWWELRIDYQGIKPPTPRRADEDFDIGSKFHVPTSVPYIRYFVAHVLQFQFHKRLCKESGYDMNLPIYNCDIYGSSDAGNLLTSMLEKGSSEPWQDQLAEFLNEEGKMDIQAMLDYFEPLNQYLKNFTRDNELKVGWSPSSEVIDNYITEVEEISAIVPIIVGAVLAVMVVIVIAAYVIGQRKRNRMEKLTKVSDGKTNYGIEMDTNVENDK